MANTNVIALGRTTAATGGLPSAGLGDATTETQFQSAASDTIFLPLPTNGELANRAFKVTAGGRVTGGGTTNFTVDLYFSADQAANTTQLESTGAVAVNSVSRNWLIELKLFWDETSDRIQGRGWSFVDTTLVAETAVDGAVTGQSPTSDGARGFTITGLFSATDAGNTAFLDVFQLEAI